MKLSFRLLLQSGIEPDDKFRQQAVHLPEARVLHWRASACSAFRWRHSFAVGQCAVPLLPNRLVTRLDCRASAEGMRMGPVVRLCFEVLTLSLDWGRRLYLATSLRWQEVDIFAAQAFGEIPWRHRNQDPSVTFSFTACLAGAARI